MAINTGRYGKAMQALQTKINMQREIKARQSPRTNAFKSFMTSTQQAGPIMFSDSLYEGPSIA